MDTARIAREAMALDDTGERMIPERVRADDVLTSRLLEHSLARYRLAAAHVAGRRALDIACGSGYGSRLLRAAGASAVVGVDVSEEAVRYARQRHGGPGLTFEAADALAYDGGPFDVIASFETLEHLAAPRPFVSHLRRLLAPGGVLLLSASTVPTSDLYVFHLHDLDEAALRALVTGAGLRIDAEWVQRDHFSPRQVRLALRLHSGSLPPSRILRSPLHYLRRGWQVVVTRGLDYRNLTLTCRA